MSNKRGYSLLIKESEKLNMPQYYRSDLLFHDKHILANTPTSLAFGWIVRTCGTHYISRTQTPDGWGVSEIKFFGTYADARCFWYDGQHLREVTQPELMDLALAYYNNRKAAHIAEGRSPAMAARMASEDCEKQHTHDLAGAFPMPDLPRDWKPN